MASMKFRIESNSLKGLLLHVSIAIGVILLLAFIFFYKVLPGITNKDEIVTVPGLTGMSFEEAKKLLVSRELGYEVTDSAYDSKVPPLTIVEQYPSPLSKVKIERKINLRLNARIAPLISFPGLTGATFDFAQRQLKALEIKIKSINYRPDIAVNTILESSLNGNKILDGQRIPKGSAIDLIVGSSANELFALPDFSGMEYDEVEMYLLGLNLKIGEIHAIDDENMSPNIVQKQNPVAGDSVQHFDTVDLWIVNFQKTK